MPRTASGSSKLSSSFIASSITSSASVFIGTIKDGDRLPGRVVLGESVRVGAGTIIENASELDLLIPDQAEIPARSYVVNDGCGQPRFVRE